MSTKKYSRRDFIGKTTVGLAGAAAAATGITPIIAGNEIDLDASVRHRYPSSFFTTEVEQLPEERLYDHHKYLSSTPVHIKRRDNNLVKKNDEMELPHSGWKISWIKGNSIIIDNTVEDFRDYLSVSQDVEVEAVSVNSLNNWKALEKTIIVGTKEQILDCGQELKGPKDYEIKVTRNNIVVCGFDERGAMFGLYNLEARMNMRHLFCP